MSTAPVERRVEREYRSPVSDNRRWEHFTPRRDDIFVCTAPKCGTTWMQTIIVTLLFPNGDAPGPVLEIAPWLDARFAPIEALMARLDAQTHRRCIKTHTAADGIPWYPTASYVVVLRDGRDACMSMLNHMRSMRPDVQAELARTAREEGIDTSGPPPPLDDVHAFFTWWMSNDERWFQHVSTFWQHREESNVLFVHYDELLADLEGQMRRVATFLGITVDDAHWPALVERCTFASMKKHSEQIADFGNFMGGADSFLYKGTNGRWRDVLTADELAEFDRRSREFLAPEALAFVNRAR